MNYFELYELPLQLAVDPQQLKKKYLQLSRAFHPDYFTLQSDAAQQEALDQSAQINNGFKVLSNADDTLKYVLQLKGMLTENEKFALPQLFLMDMLELNETVEAAAADATKRAAALAEIEAAENEIGKPVQHLLQTFGAENPPEDLAKLKEYYFKKKYIERLKEPLREKL